MVEGGEIKMLRVSVPASLLLVCLIGLGQTPSRPAWNVMCQLSSAIVTGVVESKAWVVHPDMMGSTSKALPNGQYSVTIPDPTKYVVGSIYRVRVTEVIKKYGKIRVGSHISVFVPGFMTTESPTLEEKHNFLLFLSPLESDSKQFAGTTTWQPVTVHNKRFNASSAFAVVQGPNGAIRIRPDNIELVGVVRGAMLERK